MSTPQSTGSAGMRGAPQNRLFSLPTTKRGRWSMWLAVAFIVMFAINSVFVGTLGMSTNEAANAFSRTVLPFYGIAATVITLDTITPRA